MALTLDTTTQAEYSAAATAQLRAEAVRLAMQGSITVGVYDAGDNLMGSGTMPAPFATRDSKTLTVGEVTSFSVTSSGTPDSDWYIKWTAANGRFVRGSFGVAGSGQDFTWSNPTWESGQTGTLGTITMIAAGPEAPVFTVYETSKSLPASGGTIQFTATDPNGDAVTYSLATTRTGITINATTGLVTVTSAAAGTTGNIVVRASDGLLTTDATCSVTVTAAGGGTILWSGDFSTGNFSQYINNLDYLTRVGWGFQTPNYGCPPRGTTLDNTGYTYSYRCEEGLAGGPTGELINLVRASTQTNANFSAGPTRGLSPYAVRFAVKTSANTYKVNGVEPDISQSAIWNTYGCLTDGDPANRTLIKRRSRIYGNLAIYHQYIPHAQTRWVSASIRLPPTSEFSFGNKNGAYPYDWGPVMLMIEPTSEAWDGCVTLRLTGQERSGVSWQVRHQWDSRTTAANPPYYQSFRYDAWSPAAAGGTYVDWKDDRDFPDPAASRAALADLNQGAWTDFVFQVRFDHRTVAQGGGGFIKMWMRKGSSAATDTNVNPWVYVLNIQPKTLLYPNAGYTGSGTQLDGYSYTGGLFRHGIGYNIQNADAGTSMAVSTGIYVSSGNVLYGGVSGNNLNVHVANVKVGDSNCTMADMTPDGTTV